MAAIYTWDVYSTLDGFASYTSDGDWGGYWGKEGAEFLDHRSVVLGEDQRLVLGELERRDPDLALLGLVRVLETLRKEAPRFFADFELYQAEDGERAGRVVYHKV